MTSLVKGQLRTLFLAQGRLPSGTLWKYFKESENSSIIINILIEYIFYCVILFAFTFCCKIFASDLNLD